MNLYAWQRWAYTSPDEAGVSDNTVIDITRPGLEDHVTMTVNHTILLLVGGVAFDSLLWRVHTDGHGLEDDTTKH